jgi:hypothetical protein
MAQVLDGSEDRDRRVRLPLGFRIEQPARELVFRPAGPGRVLVGAVARRDSRSGTLALGARRSHDQGNTTTYSDNDRYRASRTCARSSS